LSAKAAGDYVEYDPATERFRLPAEQAFALTDEYNPLFGEPDRRDLPDADLFNDAGTQLGVTWGRRKGASATAKARTKGKHAKPYTEVRSEMSGLVPGGVYSLFYATFGPD
jgi:hypothetical protein